MDIFYKPPMQRPDECKVLENNYIKCLMQKALKDKVMVDKCVLDGVLFFPLECPRYFSKFDDPVEFKRKFRDYFSRMKVTTDYDRQYPVEYKRVMDLRNTNFGYPEDIEKNHKVQKFTDEFEPKYSVHLTPYEEGEANPEGARGWNKDVPMHERLYGKRIEFQQL